MDRENKVEIKIQKAEKKVAAPPPTEEDFVELDLLNVEDITADAIEKANETAKAIVDGAKNEAGSIIGEATDTANRIRKDAKFSTEQERAGILLEAEKTGYKAGHDKGEAAAKAIIDEAANLRTKTLAEREETIKSLEPALVDLVIGICRKLVGENAANPQVVLHLIRQGLAQSNFTGDVVLRVSKEDYDNVTEHKDEIMESVGGGAELQIMKDFALGPGDCVIETPFGVIDSSLEMQFEEVKANLRVILEGEMGGGAI